MITGRPHLRDLEILQAIVASGKTTAAALRLGISQPAVSKAISRLEARIGRPLFERRGRLLAPTPRALALVEEAESIFAALDGLVGESGSRDAAGTLRISGPPTLMHMFLPPLIAGFLRDEPEVGVHLDIGKTPDVIAAVADGLADVGISDTLPVNSAVRVERLRRNHAQVLLPSGHRLARRRQLDVGDLSGEPLILLARRFPARGRLDQLFQDGGHVPRVVAETTTAASAVQLVRAGAGLAVLNPFPFSLAPGKDLAFVDFSPEIAIDTLLFTPARGPRSSIARRFIEFLKAHQPVDEGAGAPGVIA